MKKNVCKICRRNGQKLFLKGEKCYSPKCPLVRKSYPPGPKGKRRRGRPSEYAKELKEKQKFKNWYRLSEKQLRKYAKKTLQGQKESENLSEDLVRRIERRLDNIVFRMGFCKSSRNHARQLVLHGFFKVNDKPVDIPSFKVKKGDTISIRESKLKKPVIKEIKTLIKDKEVPSWIKINKGKLTGQLVDEPSLEEISPPADIPIIFGFYSR